MLEINFESNIKINLYYSHEKHKDNEESNESKEIKESKETNSLIVPLDELRQAVVCPKGVDLNEWLAVNGNIFLYLLFDFILF